MKRFFAILFALLLALHGVKAGDITGTVRAEGKREAEQSGGEGQYGDRRLKFAERIDYSELHDFVVYIEGPIGGKPAAPDKPLTVDTLRITQKGATFTPHVLPVVVGTVVEWPNHDDIFHNVFSVSEAKRFDLELYKAPVVKKVPFDKTGRVDVFCSIHANMHCVILVLENPYFATTDSRGRYSITNVPSGTYKLTAWHERLPALTKEIALTNDSPVKVDFVLGINNLPKY